MPEETILFGIFHFRIGNRGFTMGAPVDDSFPTIDKAFFIQAGKHFFYRFGATFVHSEPFPLPVARGTQLPKLGGNAVPVGFFPLPSPFQEAFTAQIFFGNAFFCHGGHNFGFGGNGGMVGTGKPKGAVPLHTAPTN